MTTAAVTARDAAAGAGRRRISPAARRLVTLMDQRFRLPGTRFHFGFDALIGLVPGLGDLAGLLIGALLLVEAVRLRASLGVLARMLGNLWLDMLLGSLPLVGDVLDFFFKANRRNLELLERHL